MYRNGIKSMSMNKPSKFSRPQREPSLAEIEQVIGKAETRDDPAGTAPEPKSALPSSYHPAWPSASIRHEKRLAGWRGWLGSG
jgi:hypothetical protein